MSRDKSSVNDYHFITNWQLEGTLEEVYAIIEDVDSLARWWPSVYLDVIVIERGDQQGVGKVVSLSTKGWLPYVMHWHFRVIKVQRLYSSSLEAWGDLNGHGIWTFEQEGSVVNVTYDWRIRADKPLLRTLSFLLKPVFSANHNWAMARGEESLKLELVRRRDATPEQASGVPHPPGPTFPHNLSFRRRPGDG